ncbi:uncharacterized protein CDV56_104675 [Aspergillus thermomutatus]|uniref:Amidase domain-containing protein n=1 Tax=Aspergillus thermomutatus TaxID=41047 RepID=A0A397GJ14_ASPTH|nr:uncharacterized protein CDV56_104675 [Aspergillus thermomutatus]RHZ50159.1 hypothetical protein CDV56_104675 [Aspergillus thermomutatus]
MTSAGVPWQELARQVQKRRDSSIAELKLNLPVPSAASPRVIPLARQLLSGAEVAITESSASFLLSSLAQGRLTATEVTSAFLKRAAIAQSLVNCVHELLPARALARAEELDDFFALNGKTVGPLHGLPISIKAHMGVKGSDSSAGFVAWAGRTFLDDAELLKILLAAGAIAYVRTTEPQALMMLETSSNITGVTLNPHNTALTPGGSSGGEAALQALYGSPLGVGTDMGGSIRSPAANCGIYGFKPTTFRLPLRGFAAYNIGVETIWGTPGPLSPTLDGIELFMETVLAAEPWRSDPSLHHIPWRAAPASIDANRGGRLRVGILWDDNIVTPLPPVTRALKEVVERLNLVPGVDVVEWKPYRHEEGMEILKGLYSPDKGKALASLLATSGEPMHSLTAWTTRDTPGIKELDLPGLWNLLRDREAYRYDYLQEWNRLAPDMDVILCPCHPSPAPLLDTSRYWGYTSIWNLLDYPAIVFPVTRVDPERDVSPKDYTPRNDMDRWYQEHYHPGKQQGAPINLQLVAKKMEDEKVVQALRYIKEAIGLPFVNCLNE